MRLIKCQGGVKAINPQTAMPKLPTDIRVGLDFAEQCVKFSLTTAVLRGIERMQIRKRRPYTADIVFVAQKALKDIGIRQNLHRK